LRKKTRTLFSIFFIGRCLSSVIVPPAPGYYAVSGGSIRPLKHNGRPGEFALSFARRKQEFPVVCVNDDPVPGIK
jgi:hypothetical protein